MVVVLLGKVAQNQLLLGCMGLSATMLGVLPPPRVSAFRSIDPVSVSDFQNPCVPDPLLWL